MKNIGYLMFLLVFVSLFSCKETNVVRNSNEVTIKNISENDNFEFQYAFIDANKQMMLGNYDLAKNLFLKCLKINRQDPAVNYKLSTIFLYEKNFEEALNYAKKAVEYNEDNEWYSILLATVYENLGEVDNAIKVYESLKSQFPQSPQYCIELAVLNQNSKKFEEAVMIYNEIEKLFGISEVVSMEKEKIFLALGKKGKAMEEIQKLVSFFPSDTRYLGILADYHMQDGQLQEAKNLYDKILEIEPKNGIVRISLATYYFDKGMLILSYENLKMAFESKNVEPSIKTNIILSIIEKQNKIILEERQIEELVKIIIETDKDDYNAHLLYSDILIQKGNFIKAREELEFISKNIKDKYIIWEQLILIENQLFDFEGMFNTSNEALEYFPNQAVLYLFNGIAAIQTEKFDSAIESLTFGSKLVKKDDPQKIQFYIYLAEAYYNQDNVDKAFEYFDKVLEIDSENFLVLNNYSYYLSIKGIRLEKAKEMSGKTLEIEGNNYTYLDTYAWILYKMNDFKNALANIENAIRNGGGTNAVIMEHYGDILYKLGNKKEAVEAWNRSYELGQDENVLKKIKEEELVE